MYNHETYILTPTYIMLTQITVELLLHDKFMLKGYGFFPHGQYVDTVTGHGGQGPG